LGQVVNSLTRGKTFGPFVVTFSLINMATSRIIAYFEVISSVIIGEPDRYCNG